MSRNKESGGRMSMFEEKMKDSSPLPDKDSFLQRIKMFHEFLLRLGFPGSISVKSLQSTSSTEFFKYFEFVRCFSQSSFHIHANGLEEEIPKLLKDLRYPVALCSNSRYCHKAVLMSPQNLGVLWFVWLNEWLQNWILIKMMCEMKEASSSSCDVAEGAEFNKPLMEYCCDTYRKFLEGTDTIEKEDEALLNLLLKLFTLDKKLFYSEYEKHRFIMEQVEMEEREYQDRLKREGIPAQHILEKQTLTPKDTERDNRESEELQQLSQYLTQIVDEIEPVIWNMSDSHTELEGKGEVPTLENHQEGRSEEKAEEVK